MRTNRSFEPAPSQAAPHPSATVPFRRLLLLFFLFFFICCGLGYPSLNRVDWRRPNGGLDDVQTYAALVTAPPQPDLNDHMQFRVLIPYLARPFYRLAKNRLGTWDPVMFGLLVANALCVAATVTALLLVICRRVGSYTVALGSALFYLLNFAVPNLRLVGLVDAGEALFLMLVVWSLSEQRDWTLPIWAVLGATAKESFAPFMIVFTFSWWLCSRKAPRRRASSAAWMVASWFAALASLAVLQWSITGVYRSPLQFGLGMHRNTAYLAHFVASLGDHDMWYTACWLLPLSLFRLKRLPREWRVATAITCISAFALDAYYGGGPGTIGRALFSIAGPLLSASVALFLFAPASPEKPDPMSRTVDAGSA